MNKSWYSILMRLGRNTGCHQRADRSFFLGGYQFPVCARCTGVLIGYTITLPLFIFWGARYAIAFFAAGIMLTDWMLQHRKILESTNGRRLLTGILGGYGIFTIQILLLVDILSFCNVI